jgi:hypothetical protein
LALVSLAKLLRKINQIDADDDDDGEAAGSSEPNAAPKHFISSSSGRFVLRVRRSRL